MKGAAQDARLWLLPCPGVSAWWRHSQAQRNDLPQLEDTLWSHQGCVNNVTVSKMFLIALTENHSNTLQQETASNKERARAVLLGSHHPTSSSSPRIRLPLWIFPDLNCCFRSKAAHREKLPGCPEREAGLLLCAKDGTSSVPANCRLLGRIP